MKGLEEEGGGGRGGGGGGGGGEEEVEAALEKMAEDLLGPVRWVGGWVGKRFSSSSFCV